MQSNKSVEKVSSLKNVSSAESKIGSYFVSSKVFPTPGATPKPLTKMETISILYYDCLTLSTFLFIASLIAGPLIPKCRPISLYLPHHSVSLLDCELNFEGLTPGPSLLEVSRPATGPCKDAGAIPGRHQ
jgi:hypothetical protein